MGLYSRLLEEAKQLPDKPDPPKPPRLKGRIERAPQDNSDVMATVENYRNKREEREAYEATLDQDYKVAHAWRIIDAVLTISCPACKADRGEPCGEAEEEFGATYLPLAARQKHYVHQGRIRMFGVTQGLHLEDLQKEPYNRWPWANRYRRWGIFKTNSTSDPHKKYIKKFKIYHDYKDALERAEREAAAEKKKDPQAHRFGLRYAICPLVSKDGDWIRADLAEEKPQ